MRFSTFTTNADEAFYFRVLGFGLWFASYRKWRPLFSERNGYQRVIRFWPGWRMKFLTPWN